MEKVQEAKDHTVGQKKPPPSPINGYENLTEESLSKCTALGVRSILEMRKFLRPK